MNELTLIIPAKNEKESLPSVLEELKAYQINVIIILEKDDFETIDAIKSFDKELIFQSNKGYGDALILGINNVKTKYFCIFNADGSFNPAELQNMYKKIKTNNFDLLFATRYEKNAASDDDTIVTFIGNKIFTLLGKIFFSLSITDILYTFVICETQKVQSLNLKQKDFSFCVELPIKAQRNNCIISTIPSHERERIGGEKKVNAFKDGFIILKHMIKMYFNLD